MSEQSYLKCGLVTTWTFMSVACIYTILIILYRCELWKRQTCKNINNIFIMAFRSRIVNSPVFMTGGWDSI